MQAAALMDWTEISTWCSFVKSVHEPTTEFVETDEAIYLDYVHYVVSLCITGEHANCMQAVAAINSEKNTFCKN